MICADEILTQFSFHRIMEIKMHFAFYFLVPCASFEHIYLFDFKVDNGDNIVVLNLRSRNIQTDKTNYREPSTQKSNPLYVNL